MMDAHLASGPTVGAAQQYIQWLRKKDRNLKALEMESAGLMAAATRRVTPARTFVIRGIQRESLVPDGVFVPQEDGVRFEALLPPTQAAMSLK